MMSPQFCVVTRLAERQRSGFTLPEQWIISPWVCKRHSARELARRVREVNPEIKCIFVIRLKEWKK